jgi:hypothetical protein
VRRLLLVVLMVAVGSGLTEGSASAGSLRVRTDPNDSSSILDIHKVITNLSATTMYLRLNSWERFRLRDMQETWAFALDTHGTRRIDRWVVIFPARHGLKCDVRGGRNGVQRIGMRHASRPDRRSAACHLPRGWFGHIDRAVRFKAYIHEASSPGDIDNAPNHGLYRWI